MEGPRHREERLLGDELDAGGQVGVMLVLAAQLGIVGWLVAEIRRISRRFGEEVALGVARRAEEAFELGVECGVGRMVVGEVIHVEGERPVVVQPHELAYVIGVLRGPVRRHPHHLVLALVDLEAQKGREDAVEEPQGMWEADLAEKLEVRAPAHAERRGRPLTNPIHGEDRRLVVRRAVEAARRVRDVVAAEQDLLCRDSHPFADQPLDPELVREPPDHRFAKETERPRKRLERRHQDPIELHEGLLVEDDPVQILGPELAGPEAELDRVEGKPSIVLDARETLFFRRGDDDPVLDERGRGVVKEA